MSTQEMYAEVLAMFSDPNMLACLGGGVALIATVAFLVRLKNKGLLPNKLERKIAKARKMGHVAEGRCILSGKYNNNRTGGPREMAYSATYEFVVDGETYRTSVTTFRNILPETTAVYYLNSPKRAFTSYEPHQKGLLPVLLVALCMAVFYITITLLGFDPNR